MVKTPSASAGGTGDGASVPGSEDPPAQKLAAHPSIPAWKTPWTEKPGGLQSMGRQELDTTARARG